MRRDPPQPRRGGRTGRRPHSGAEGLTAQEAAERLPEYLRGPYWASGNGCEWRPAKLEATASRVEDVGAGGVTDELAETREKLTRLLGRNTTLSLMVGQVARLAHRYELTRLIFSASPALIRGPDHVSVVSLMRPLSQVAS